MNNTIASIIKKLYDINVDIVLTRPDPQFGDYATNIAMQLAGQLGRSPREIAEEIAEHLRQTGDYAEITVAGPGFLNILLSDASLAELMYRTIPQTMTGQTVVTEYSDPNPFKVLHAGHLYTTIVGDAMSRLLERAGAKVHRTNFGGDVGLHVAKNMWAILRHLDGENPGRLDEVDSNLHMRASWLSERYVEGNAAYEDDETARAEIIEINKRIYRLHEEGDHDSNFAQIYWMCRDWSYEYFDLLYRELEVSPFERYYPESETTPTGLATIRAHIDDGVYTESEGAIVFEGERYDLHTRVFINSAGLPTYEAKDVGLLMHKWQDYKFDRSIVITGNDIIEYMKVVLKSVEQYEPELVARTTHLTHGNLRLTGGRKMSSRKGNVLLALDVLDAASEAQKQAFGGNADRRTMLGAVKYSFLSNRVGGDIIYDPAESVSVHGNSGPYLQYAHARACSILARVDVASTPVYDSLDPHERMLARKLGEYSEVVVRAIDELLPHLVCNYLYELTQEFNRFYEHCAVVQSDRMSLRVGLVARYRDILAEGLGLLGISAPEKL